MTAHTSPTEYDPAADLRHFASGGISVLASTSRAVLGGANLGVDRCGRRA